MIEPGEALSEREIEILRLVATGVSNKEIATALSISPNTVKVHLRNIFSKIGVLSRTEATLYAIKTGIVARPSSEVAGLDVVNPQAADNPLALASDQTFEPEPTRRLPVRIVILWALIVVVVLIAAITISNNVLKSASPSPTLPANALTNPPRWQSNPGLPEGRAAMGAVAYNNNLYLVGGDTATGVSGDLIVYNLASNEWKQLAAKPTPVNEVKAVLIGEKVYVPGGKRADGSLTGVLEVYDPRQNTWETRAPMPAPISNYALTAYEGNLYLFGGWDGKKISDLIYRYDPDTDRWETRKLIPGARMTGAAATLDGRILLIGGQAEQGGLKEVWIYYPDRDSEGDSAWQKGPNLPDARYGFAAATLANSVFVLGGQSSPSDQRVQPVLVLTADSENWQSIDLPAQMIGSQVALLAAGNYLHVLGGQVNGRLESEHLVYQALYTVSIPLISNEGGTPEP